MVHFSKIRDFGELFEDTFAFARENAKELLKGYAFIVLPAFILLGAMQVLFMGQYFDALNTSISNPGTLNSTLLLGELAAAGFPMIIASLVTYILLYGFAYAFIEQKLENPLAEATAADIWTKLKAVSGKIITTGLIAFIGLIALVFGIALVFAMLANLGGFGIFLNFFLGIGIIIGMFYLATLLNLIIPIRIREDEGFGEAFGRARFLMSNAFWQTFGIVFVVSLIVSIIQSMLSAPFAVASAFTAFQTASTGGGLEKPALWISVGSVIVQAIVGILYILPIIAVYLQYFNLKERKEGTDLEAQIDAL